MKSVAGKVAFVTGGASGMGLAMARSFSAAGMKVVIADIEQAALDKVQAEFRASNSQALTLKVDVTNRDAMEAAAKETERAFGKVHVVCNNAGVVVGGAVDDMNYRDWDWVVGVNLAGVINGVQTFVNRIKSHGEGGHIVNTASMAGHLAIPGLGVYNTTKYAVVGMSEVMRLDLAPHRIGVSVLCPGVVNTNIFASGRNRPAALQRADKDTAAMVLQTNVPEGERDQQMRELMSRALDPAVVGDMVLNAIQNDEFYIFTHPELKGMVEQRAAEIGSAFDRWAKYRDEHGV
jgi:NAD(P)-dependent dehydrogenase (short-subunit alcohol dehydrogenase family)